MRPDSLNGGIRVHSPSRFWREIIFRSDYFIVADSLLKYGSRDNASNVRGCATSRNVFQLYYVHGGVVGGFYNPYLKLSPPKCGYTYNVTLGK